MIVLTQNQILYLVIGVLVVAVVIALIFGWEFLAAGQFASGVIAAGDFSLGIVAAGTFAVGIFAAGLFSVGVFSVGIFSVGIFTVGIFVYAYRKRTLQE